MEYRINSEKLREKRKALRIEKNGKLRMASQDDFRDLLKEKGCSIGRNSLSKLENGEIPDELPLKDILAFCDVLGCDINYLLDISDYSTKELETVCTYTGLSEKAVKELHRIKSDKNSVTPALSNIIENHADSFVEIIRNIDGYCRDYLFFKYISSIKNQDEITEDMKLLHQNNSSVDLMNCQQWISDLGYTSNHDIYYIEQLKHYKDFIDRKPT